MLTLERGAANDYGEPVRREWLVANGIGGYAMGAVTGSRTRRYHGLLVAALHPPVGRWLMATSLDETFEHGKQKYRFSGKKAQGRTIVAKQGLDFRLEGTTPVWSYNTREFHLQKRVFMAHGANTTYVRYTLLRADAPVRLIGIVNAVFRDHHAALIRAPDNARLQPPESSRPRAEVTAAGLRIAVTPEAAPLTVAGREVAWTPRYEWNFDEYLSVEHERGFDHIEDTLAVAEYTANIDPGESVTLVLSAEREPELDGEWAFNAHRERESALLKDARLKRAPVEVKQLVHTADQFIVRRGLDDGTQGYSVIAGYPWFGDWGRDTMIALPGLTLTTRRFDVARGILTTFARYVDQGMLPNRFPDGGEAPEYNTADATLWYFEAIRAYYAATGDRDTVRELFPVLADIVAHHVAGTRFSIAVDPADGLLRAGSGGDNLTWMDAKIDGLPMTPRHGKPVEICGLWINALAVMRNFSALLKQPHGQYAALLERASASFSRFWDAKRGYLKDVLDADDATLRPNQLIAAMLPGVPLSTPQLRSIVDVCQAKLYTPFGIRSLTPDDPAYRGIFAGDWRTRDSMYHQGPAWSWLLGPFIGAHLRAYGDRDAARELLDASLVGLYDGCVGNVSELFDGDPPHHPRAACAQAWGVSELLRIWTLLAK